MLGVWKQILNNTQNCHRFLGVVINKNYPKLLVIYIKKTRDKYNTATYLFWNYLA